MVRCPPSKNGMLMPLKSFDYYLATKGLVELAAIISINSGFLVFHCAPESPMRYHFGINKLQRRQCLYY